MNSFRLTRTKSKIVKNIRLLSYLLVGVFLLSLFAPMNAKADEFSDRIEEQKLLPVDTNEIDNWPVGPIVGAESAILMDAETGAILYSKNIDLTEFPASTTKILTCVLALEYLSLDDVITFSYDAIHDTPRDSSNIALDVGEKLTVAECMEAILIRSANECCFAIAEEITGTTDWSVFSDMMNERAQALGATNTHFSNPNGLPADDHYTTARDLALISKPFFDSEYLCKVSSTRYLHLYPTDYQPDEIYEKNATKILPGNSYGYDYLIGCKTGFTSVARSCLVSCAEKNGLKLICVVMNDEDPLQYQDTISLFEYGFSNFVPVNISEVETRFNIASDDNLYSKKNIFRDSTPILALNKNDYIIQPANLKLEDLTSEISYDTPNEGAVASINYSYKGQFLGAVSVDFASAPEKQTVNETSSISIEHEEEEVDDEPNIIFINIIRVVLIILAALAIIILLRVIIGFMIYYHRVHPNLRRNWQRERRRKKKGKPLSIRRQSAQARRELKRVTRKRERGRKYSKKRNVRLK